MGLNLLYWCPVLKVEWANQQLLSILAFALQSLGLKIGILDADVYGPSLPKLMKK